MSNYIYFLLGFLSGSLVTYLITSQKNKRRRKSYRLNLSNDSNQKLTYVTDLDNSLDKDKELVVDSEEGEKIDVKNAARESSDVIVRFLNEKKIQVKSIPDEGDEDEVLDKIAVFMGVRYELIEKFYRRIKSNISLGKSFRMNLKNETQDEVSAVCQLATRLHRIAFLEEYNYQNSPKFLLHARPSKIPKAINFFTGQWLERFIKSQVIELIETVSEESHYAYLLNPKIVLPNGDDFELDVIFSINGKIFWFEGKTGDYQRHVNKYSRISSLLDLDKEHSFMVLTNISESSARDLSLLFNMTVVSVEKFSGVLQKAINPSLVV